ncbi:alpha/beta hydrolase family protein [Nocardia carnea]|uniref:alpha/beta hydrolase family protein n=1 Tax=Nocardia carnea TaxID=37328 RepID=UPI002456AEB4|nr:chlorophyllase [Nocardia carnea]
MTSSNSGIPGPAATPVVSVKPIVLPAPDRGEDLHVRVSAPVTGQDLPIILLSHGYSSSLDGYGPLADHWAAHGFVVLQPTHLDSKTLPFVAGDPRRPHHWRFRVDDMVRILDNLDVLEAAVPGLAGRSDRTRIAAAGHSFGGQTAGILLGLRVRDPSTGHVEDRADPRITAGILLATAGEGGESLTPFAREHAAWLSDQDFSQMATPTLVVAGDADDYPLTVRGPDWTTDPYTLSPGDKSLLTLFGAEHFLGGISGYRVAETTDENPERVALIQAVTTAYLRHIFGIDSTGWKMAHESLAANHPLGRLESARPADRP